MSRFVTLTQSASSGERNATQSLLSSTRLSITYRETVPPCGPHNTNDRSTSSGLFRISYVEYLSRERVKSTFYEDFVKLVSDTIPQERRIFNYYEEKFDEHKNYKVDCKINGMKRPVFVYAVNSEL